MKRVLRRVNYVVLVAAVVVTAIAVCCLAAGCMKNADRSTNKIVNNQQSHYIKVQPVPYYDYSIPRDVLTQIYNVSTQEARNTYTVIQSMTGVVQFSGPSVGYGIPADTQLTNGLKNDGSGVAIEQPEPNGLYSSKNTDGTWVLFVDTDGSITPIYTEQKVTTYPFAVTRNAAGEWVRADNQPASFNVKINEDKKK